MIDSITLRFSPLDLPNNYSDILSQVPELYKETSLKDDGSVKIKGKWRGFSIEFTSSFLWIRGSLNNFVNKSSIYSLELNDIHEAIQKLSAVFRLDFYEAKVTRLDMAENLVLSMPVKDYYDCLESHSTRERTVQPSGALYYTNKSSTLTFYDKIGRLKNKKLEIPTYLKDSNVLRVEYRFSNAEAIGTVVKNAKPTVADILDNYQSLVKVWYDSYSSICKRPRISFRPEAFSSTTILSKQLQILGIKSLGGENALDILLKSAKRRGYTSKSGKNNQYMLHKFRCLMSEESLIEEEDLVTEMDEKMMAYYLFQLCSCM